MKPDDVCGQDMDGEDWLPQQLFEGVGFLVLEARTPHGATAKGRVEGPHCPSTQQQTGHLCSQFSEECRKAEQVRRQMELLWRNGIPMCIEASLYPRCPHGLEEARSIHTECGATGASSDENRVLLERWTVQVLPKRHADKSELSVTPRFLLQAVRSFLHFSQLSAWLTSTQGRLPYPIAYRLFAPGDNVWDDFSQKTDTHSFPQADVNQVTIQVSVESIPRLPTIPKVFCRFSSEASVAGKLKAENGSNAISQSAGRKASCYGEALGADSKNNNNNSSAPRPDSVLDQQCNESCAGLAYKSLAVQSQSETLKCQHSVHGGTQVLSAKPKVKLKPFEFTASSVSTNPIKGHNLLTPAKRKDSPKVLFTSSAHMTNAPPVYHKRFLDFDQSDSDSESNGSEKTCSWDGLKLTSRLQSMSPGFPARNSTEDLEAYLATIADHSLWREEQLKNIPIRKCKFFIGDKLDDAQSPSDEDLSSLSLNQMPVRAVTAEECPIENLCKNLYKQTFQEILVDENQLKKPSLGHKQEETRSRDNAKSTMCDKINNSYQKPKTDPQSQSDFHSNSPMPGTSHNCDFIPIQTNISPDATCRRFKRRQTVPNDLVEIRSERRTIRDNSTASNGTKPQSVISNGAIVKPTTLSIHQGPKAHTGFAGQTKNGVTPDGRGSLHKSFLKKNFSHLDQPIGTLPSPAEISSFHHDLEKSASMMFNTSTGLPSRSSPAPIKKKSSGKFDYDSSLTNSRAIKNAISCSKLSLKIDDKTDGTDPKSNHTLSTSAPASTNSLLGNFEESVLNGRIEPIGVVDGFTTEIGASGAFCPKHITLPVTSYFFSLSDDNAPSPYLGHINLDINKRRGYHVPKAGTVQVTLFNPNKTVVKMFVVRYDLSEMPSNCQTFLRQRTLYTPVNKEKNVEDPSQPSFLRYLIHLRFVSSKSGKIYLHTDIRLIFARDKFEFDPRVANYELRSFTEGPRNPKFSPKR